MNLKQLKCKRKQRTGYFVKLRLDKTIKGTITQVMIELHVQSSTLFYDIFFLFFSRIVLPKTKYVVNAGNTPKLIGV